jgi:hypothetical protein
MSVPLAWPRVLDFFGTPLVIEPSLRLTGGTARCCASLRGGKEVVCLRGRSWPEFQDKRAGYLSAAALQRGGSNNPDQEAGPICQPLNQSGYIPGSILLGIVAKYRKK